MSLTCFVGIDLGSTTTKAVILGEGAQVLGRGITNSRSNYDLACQVARTEAYINARFTLFARHLPEGLSLDRVQILSALELQFRREQFLSQYEVLRHEMEKEAAAPVHSEGVREVPSHLAVLMDTVAKEAESMFRPGYKRGSDFFRDQVGSLYSKAAERAAVPGKAPFDVLMSLYDKCILKVENHALDLSFGTCIKRARERTLGALEADNAGKFGANERKAVDEAIHRAVETGLREANTVGTGYGRARLPFPKEQIRSEILCHGLGAHLMFPKTATVLDIGGQDTKAIQVDPEGIVTSFQMNDRCAAGCGRYLGYIADELGMGLHELGPMAQKSRHQVKINSTCTVFAGAELRERLSLGQKREDILSGLHRAIILRAMSLLARSGGIKNEFTFTGGVANNVAAVEALKKLVAENYASGITMNISPNSIYTGALGAAMFALRSGEGQAMTASSAEGRSV
ncbi:MAG: BadF/BadG/BcrA/BcrD ATPase family protein [Planctomycetota bacterium]